MKDIEVINVNIDENRLKLTLPKITTEKELVKAVSETVDQLKFASSVTALLAWRIGGFLHRYKTLIKHGETEKFYTQCGLTERTARRYKQVYELIEEHDINKADLKNKTITEILQIASSVYHDALQEAGQDATLTKSQKKLQPRISYIIPLDEASENGFLSNPIASSANKKQVYHFFTEPSTGIIKPCVVFNDEVHVFEWEFLVNHLPTKHRAA